MKTPQQIKNEVEKEKREDLSLGFRNIVGEMLTLLIVMYVGTSLYKSLRKWK